MFRAPPEKLARLRADLHQSKRAFRLLASRDLTGIVDQVIECWLASCEDHRTGRDEAVDPTELQDCFHANFGAMGVNEPSLASGQALSWLRGNDHPLHFARASRQVRGLAEVLHERGLHGEVVRLAAWCAACRPETHPRPIDFSLGSTGLDAHQRALLDLDTRGEFCF